MPETKNELEKKVFCANERPIHEIIADLSRPIHRQHLRTKTQGKAQITFVPWYLACKYLDHYAPGWFYEVKQVCQGMKAGDIALLVRLSIPAKDGLFYREAMALEPYSEKMYGDPYTNAEGAALRRAAAKFGLGRSLYEKE